MLTKQLIVRITLGALSVDLLHTSLLQSGLHPKSVVYSFGEVCLVALHFLYLVEDARHCIS